jgi:hypothetical protein
MTRRDDTESGEHPKIDLSQLGVDVPPRGPRVGHFDHTEPYGSRIPNAVGTPTPVEFGPDAPTPAAAPESKKAFDPWKFARTTLPPGLRRELILAEMPDSPECAAPELEQPAPPPPEQEAPEPANIEAKTEAAPPTTVRAPGERPRDRRRRGLWLLAPFLAFCLLGGAIVSVMTKRPHASTSPASDNASRPAPGAAEQPSRDPVLDRKLESALPAPLPSNVKAGAPSTKDEPLKAARQSIAPKVGIAHDVPLPPTSKGLKSSSDEASSAKSAGDATETSSGDAAKTAPDPSPAASAAPAAAPPKRRKWAELK